MTGDSVDLPLAIEARGLEKRFGEVRAVAGLDIQIRTGELFGFLGPNGAGKTTTINLLTGLARPDAGTIHIAGIDCIRRPRGAQHLLGVVPDESNLYPELSGFANLCFCGALYGMGRREREERAEGLLHQLGLGEAAHRKFGGYSKGMKRRLTIAAGVIHSPPILFLDEPTTGIDVAAARQIRRYVAELGAAGTTILLTTHYIEEAERLCGRVAFVVAGRVVQVGAVEDLLREHRDRHAVQVVVTGTGEDAARVLGGAFPALRVEPGGGGLLRVESREPIKVGAVVRFLEERGVEVTEARVLRASLEDVFVGVTGLEVSAMESGEPVSSRSRR